MGKDLIIKGADFSQNRIPSMHYVELEPISNTINQYIGGYATSAPAGTLLPEGTSSSEYIRDIPSTSLNYNKCHLKKFDISNYIALNINLQLSTTGLGGISLILTAALNDNSVRDITGKIIYPSNYTYENLLEVESNEKYIYIVTPDNTTLTILGGTF